MDPRALAQVAISDSAFRLVIRNSTSIRMVGNVI